MSEQPLFSHASKPEDSSIPRRPVMTQVETVLPSDQLSACEGLLDYANLWWPREYRLLGDPESQIWWDERGLIEVDSEGHVAVWGQNHGSEPPLEISVLLANSDFPESVLTVSLEGITASSTRVTLHAPEPLEGSTLPHGMWSKVVAALGYFFNPKAYDRTE